MTRQSIVFTFIAALIAAASLPHGPADAQYSDSRNRYQWNQSQGGKAEAIRFETTAVQTYERRASRIVFRLDPRAGRTSQFRFKSVDDYMLITGIEIRFADGGIERATVYDRLSPGEESVTFTVRDGRRLAREITVLKRPSWRSGRAKLELLRPEQKKFQPAATANFERRSRSVTFGLNPKLGRTSQIRLKSIDDYILVTGLEIKYANGNVQRIEVYDRLSPGEESPPIAVGGDRSPVREVVVFKRPSWRFGRARLELQNHREERQRIDIVSKKVPKNWVLFGTKRVGFGIDRDRINIVRPVGLFDFITLRTTGNDIFLRKITVVYGNGEKSTWKVNARIPINSRTSRIPLRGNRFINRIELVYNSRPGAGVPQAVVEVYGHFAKGWFGQNGRWKKYNRGWMLLGAQRARMYTAEKDKFPLGKGYGKFKRVKLTARGQAVRIYGIRIVYGNGTVSRPPVYGRLRPGQSTAPIDLKGDARNIKAVYVRYRTKLNARGAGIVELWGKP